MKTTIAHIVCLLCLFGFAPANGHAGTVTLTTQSTAFNPGVFNQGWWLATSGANSTLNDSVLTGNVAGQEQRGFYTFDLASPLLQPRPLVTAATLQIQRSTLVSDMAAETIGFFDVSTDAATLNNNTGANPGIFADLGTGNSYGSFSVTSGDPLEILNYSLNATAVSDINAHLPGFFSVGATWLSISSPDDYGFGASSENFAVRLVLQTQAIPEPSVLPLLLVGAAGLLGCRRRQRAVPMTH